MHLEATDLLDIAKTININIETRGMKRYDPSDIRNLSVISQNNAISKRMRKVLLLIENLQPVLLRKILRIEKKFYPTAFTHLAEAYFCAERYNITLPKKKSSIEVIEEAIEEYLRNYGDEYYWNCSKNYSFFIDKRMINKKPTMHMHGLARLNIILLKIGEYYKKYDLIEIACKSAVYAMKNHQIANYGNGIMSISYYYNSIDCTININTEFAQWLSMIPSNLRNNEMNELVKGIVRLAIKEQNEDGSWYYFSKDHMKKWGNKPIIDCHHTGTILSNLINVLNYYPFEVDLKNELIESINKGMMFYINNFFDFNLGSAKTIIGYKRPAGPVQYSEAIFAFCDYITSEQLANIELKSKIKKLLPKIMSQAVTLVNINDGSAPSEKIVKWIHIDSIRWGNGPILQAIMRFLSIYDEIYV